MSQVEKMELGCEGSSVFKSPLSSQDTIPSANLLMIFHVPAQSNTLSSFFKLIFVEVQLLHNVVLVSTGYRSISALCTYIPFLMYFPLW